MRKAASQLRLIVYTTLGQNSLCVGVFDLFHLGDEVGELDELGVSVSAGADDVDILRSGAEALDDLIGVEHFIADDVIDFVEDDEVVGAAVDGVAAGGPALVRHLDVFRISFGAADFDEAATHRPDFELVVAEHFGGVEFAVMPRTLDELDHQDAQPLADGAKCGSERAGRFALARACVDDQKSFVLRHASIFLGGVSVSVELQALHQFMRDGGDPFFGCLRKTCLLIRLFIVKNDPESWSINFVIAGANRAG